MVKEKIIVLLCGCGNYYDSKGPDADYRDECCKRCDEARESYGWRTNILGDWKGSDPGPP